MVARQHAKFSENKLASTISSAMDQDLPLFNEILKHKMSRLLLKKMLLAHGFSFPGPFLHRPSPHSLDEMPLTKDCISNEH